MFSVYVSILPMINTALVFNPPTSPLKMALMVTSRTTTTCQSDVQRVVGHGVAAQMLTLPPIDESR
jgi:hypothetical protein